MKKLLMFAIAATFAVVSQAAQFEWSASQVREGWDDPNNKASGTAYLFLVAGDITEASIASAISGATSSSTLATTLEGKSIDKVSFTGGAPSSLTGEVSATAPVDLFFVVISGDNVYQSAKTTVTSIEALGGTPVAFGSQKSATSAASAWANVGGGGGGDIPEPTSALLLLMGGAMLALRRKRA